MLKSILPLFAGALLALAPFALSGRIALAHAQQDATSSTPAQQAAPTPDQSAAPLGTTPMAGDTTAPSAPLMAADMKNPVKPTPDSQAKAKQLYSIDCAMCHGDNGDGKTDLATSMGLSLVDFTDAKILVSKGDGELFNQIRNGKGKMPPEAAARANDAEVWNLVIYLRNFSKPQAGASAQAR